MDEYRKLMGFEKFFSIQDGYIKELLKIHQDKVLFLTFSDTYEYYQDYLSDLQANEKVSYLELESLSSNKGFTYLPDDVHPTVQGHRFIESKVYQYLLDNNIIPCD